MMITVDEINSKEQFMSLKKAWNSLLKKSNHYSPFLTHDWFQCCLNSQIKERQLIVLAVRDKDNLICIAPLWKYTDKIRGVTARKISFIKCKETPFVDFVVKEDNTKTACEAILKYIFSHLKEKWDLLTFDHFPSDSYSYIELSKILRNRKTKWFEAIDSVTPYMSLNVKWDEYYKKKSHRFKKTYRNIINRIKRLERVEIKCITDGFQNEDFKSILAVSRSSWKQRANVAITSDKNTIEFFLRLTEVALREGWLLIWLMKVNYIPIAMEYDLMYEGNVYALRADFDESYKEYSPGAYLEYELLKYLHDNNFREYSFGPGLNNYKLHWTKMYRMNIGMTVCNDTPNGFGLWLIEKKIIPWLKAVRNLHNQTLQKFKKIQLLLRKILY